MLSTRQASAGADEQSLIVNSEYLENYTYTSITYLLYKQINPNRSL